MTVDGSSNLTLDGVTAITANLGALGLFKIKR